MGVVVYGELGLLTVTLRASGSKQPSIDTVRVLTCCTYMLNMREDE